MNLVVFKVADMKVSVNGSVRVALQECIKTAFGYTILKGGRRCGLWVEAEGLDVKISDIKSLDLDECEMKAETVDYPDKDGVVVSRQCVTLRVKAAVAIEESVDVADVEDV